MPGNWPEDVAGEHQTGRLGPEAPRFDARLGPVAHFDLRIDNRTRDDVKVQRKEERKKKPSNLTSPYFTL